MRQVLWTATIAMLLKLVSLTPGAVAGCAEFQSLGRVAASVQTALNGSSLVDQTVAAYMLSAELDRMDRPAVERMVRRAMPEADRDWMSETLAQIDRFATAAQRGAIPEPLRRAVEQDLRPALESFERLARLEDCPDPSADPTAGSERGIGQAGSSPPAIRDRGGSSSFPTPLERARNKAIVLGGLAVLGLCMVAAQTLLFWRIRRMRSFHRYICHFPTEMRPVGKGNAANTTGAPAPVTIVDISRYGAKLARSDAGAWPDRMDLLIGAGWVQGQTLWTNAGHAGIQLDDKLTDAQMSLIRGRTHETRRPSRLRPWWFATRKSR